jgi:hypothetical protein
MKAALSTSMGMRMMKNIRIEKSMIINNNNPMVQNSAAIDLEWIPFDGTYSHDKTRITSQLLFALTKEKE